MEWWEILLIVIVSAIVGAGIYSFGWNAGVKYERIEQAHRRYMEAMKNE